MSTTARRRHDKGRQENDLIRHDTIAYMRTTMTEDVPSCLAPGWTRCPTHFPHIASSQSTATAAQPA